MSKIQFVYFDLGNVLLEFCHDAAARQMAEVAGVPVDVTRRVVFADGLEDRYERGELSNAAFYDAFCAATDTRPDPAALLLAASDIFRLKVEMLPIVNGLHAAGTPLGILSNTCPAHWEFVTQGRFRILNACFREFILSYEVRSMKPDREIYDAAIQAAGVAPDEIFFMDDRIENVQAANAAGLDAVHFTDARTLQKAILQRQIPTNC